MPNIDRADIERLYRMVADRRPREEVLEEIYSLAGPGCGLRPPVSEIRLARNCRTEQNANV